MRPRVLLEKREGNSLLGRLRRALKDKNKMDLTINWMQFCGLD